MFESLTDKLSRAFAKITSRGVLTEQDIDSAMREIRIALLEADVSLAVVKDFIAKVKEFNECELVITGIETGPFRVINYKPDGTSYEATEEVVTNLLSTYQGYPISIGSGLSIESRRLFKSRPELIVGKTVTIKYFEQTMNESGGLSLRFPTLKTIHGLERTE